MPVYIRVDDFPGTKPEEFYKHNLENFKKFDERLLEYVYAYHLGVIPKHVTEEQLRFLKQHKRIEVALHGINHDERYRNEFREHQTEADILQALRFNKHFLEQSAVYDKIVETYIPPHNEIDHRTCRALKDAGFYTILCGPGTDLGVIEYARSIGLTVCYSAEGLEYGRSDELLSRGVCIPHILEKSKKENVLLTLHWPWEYNIGLEHLEKFLDMIKEELVYL